MSAKEFYGFDESQRVRYKRWKSYLQNTLTADFELMAELALRPKTFDDSVQFAGKEEDSLDPDGKQTASRTGNYKLDPLLQARIDLCKFRLKELFPKPPKEVELPQQTNAPGLPQTVINELTLIQQNFSISSSSETPLSSPKNTVGTPKILPAQNGNLLSEDIIGSLTTTEESNKDSSPKT